MAKKLSLLIICINLLIAQGAGDAIDFDGSNDYVSIADDASLTSTSALTISAWFKKESDANWMSIVGKGTSDTDEEYVLMVKDDQVYFDVGDGYGPYIQRSVTIDPETWHHITAVHFRSGVSALKVYLNGVDVGGSTVGSSRTPNDNGYPATIGSRASSGSLYFEGQIDEVRIWDDARTASEIQEYMHKELAGNESGLVAYYKMSNGTGSSLTDNSSNSNTGTLTNMYNSSWVTSQAPIGDLGSSYQTDTEGIWRSTGTNASDASDGFAVTVSSALSTGNFAVFGNNNTSGISSSDLGSVSSTDRTGRIWQVDESGTVAGTVTIDMSDATGISGLSGTASNYRLLYRSNTSGDFSSVATGASISGDVVSFTSISLADGYYALGGQGDASLPVDLSSFDLVSSRSNEITLQWVTESEIDNLGFIVDRRTISSDWAEIASYITHPELQGQGSVSYQTTYSFTDETVLEGETYDYRLADVDYNGNKEYHTLQLMGVSPSEPIPGSYKLHQNYPNPFNPITTFQYDLPIDNTVKITITNVKGYNIKEYIRNNTAGTHQVQWDGKDRQGHPVSAGVYLYTIQAGDFINTKKMILLK